MLSTVVNVLKLFVYYVFAASYETGRLIVTATSGLIQGIHGLYANVVILIKIVIEDFGYFLKDVLSAFQICIDMVGGFVSSIYRIFASISNGLLTGTTMLLSCVYELFNSVINTVQVIINSVQAVVVVVKKLIVLFGSGVWFALTLIPLCIFYTFTIVINYIRSVINEAGHLVLYAFSSFYKIVLDVVNFIIDVPLESFLGISAALCIMYVLVHYHLILVDYVSQRANRLARGICNSLNIHFLCLKRTFRNVFRRNSNEDIPVRRVNFNDEDVNNQLCVVCHERLKCILMLPCRHVCLCKHCASKLKATNNTCPLCRRHIDKTMKVFV